MPKSNFYGWKMLSALWIIVFINLAFPIYGQSILNAVMLTDLNLDRRTLGLITGLYTLMSGLPGPLSHSVFNGLEYASLYFWGACWWLLVRLLWQPP